MEASIKIIDWLETEKGAAQGEKGAAVTLGVFDGVHLGHRALIERIVLRGPCPTVLSFRENPKKLLDPEHYGGDILSAAQKREIFESLGVERLILIDFSKNFSKIKGRDFINLLEERISPGFLALGSNFRCGHNRDTDAAVIKKMLAERGIPTEVLQPVMLGGLPVSSTRIREAIRAGDRELAGRLLGRPFEREN